MRPVGDIRCLEDALDVRFVLDAHVLLSEGLGMLLEVGIFLRASGHTRAGQGLGRDGQRTSCSDRGTLVSFILWTPAEADVSSEPAARRMDVFMTTTKLRSLQSDEIEQIMQ